MKLGDIIKSVVVCLYSPFYGMVGSITKPTKAEQCELGDWWVECDYDELPRNPWGENISIYTYSYTYQKISQNCFGKWQKEKQWIGRHYSLDFYRSLRER